VLPLTSGTGDGSWASVRVAPSTHAITITSLDIRLPLEQLLSMASRCRRPPRSTVSSRRTKASLRTDHSLSAGRLAHLAPQTFGPGAIRRDGVAARARVGHVSGGPDRVLQ